MHTGNFQLHPGSVSLQKINRGRGKSTLQPVDCLVLFLEAFGEGCLLQPTKHALLWTQLQCRIDSISVVSKFKCKKPSARKTPVALFSKFSGWSQTQNGQRSQSQCVGFALRLTSSGGSSADAGSRKGWSDLSSALLWPFRDQNWSRPGEPQLQLRKNCGPPAGTPWISQIRHDTSFALLLLFQMTYWVVLCTIVSVMSGAVSLGTVASCPQKCTCKSHNRIINCTGQKLDHVPNGIPPTAEELYLGWELHFWPHCQVVSVLSPWTESLFQMYPARQFSLPDW